MSNRQSCHWGRTETAALYEQIFITKHIQQDKIDFQQQFNLFYVLDFFLDYIQNTWHLNRDYGLYLLAFSCMIWRDAAIRN